MPIITSPHIRRFSLLLIGLIGVCAGGAIIIALTERPRPLLTHRDTIVHILDQRGIAYNDVTFTQNYEDSVELDFYRAAVHVHLTDGRIAHGWIGCEDRDRICFLELRSIGIAAQPLPEMTQEQRWPWLDWLRRYVR